MQSVTEAAYSAEPSASAQNLQQTTQKGHDDADYYKRQ